MALAALFFLCLNPFSEGACLHCWESHSTTLGHLTADGCLPVWGHGCSRPRSRSRARKLTSGGLRTCSPNMPTTVQVSAKDLTQAQAGTSGMCGLPESLTWALPWYPCTYCPSSFKEYCFWWTQTIKARTTSDSNEERKLWVSLLGDCHEQYQG